MTSKLEAILEICHCSLKLSERGKSMGGGALPGYSSPDTLALGRLNGAQGGGEVVGGGGGCAQQITAHNNPYSSFSALLLPSFPVFLSSVYPACVRCSHMHIHLKLNFSFISFHC